MNASDVAGALSAHTPSAAGSTEAVASIPTGSLALDAAIGAHGWPEGRISRIYGESMAGKSTLLYHSIAAAQEVGLQVVLMDFHGHFDPVYAGAIGVRLDALLILSPRHGLLDIRDWPGDFLAFDGISDQYQADQVWGSVPWQKTAILVTQGFRVRGSGFACGVSRVQTLDVPNAVVSVRLSPAGPVSGGILVRAEVRRDDTRDGVPPEDIAYRSAVFTVRYGEGIDQIDGMISLGLKAGLIRKAGNWYFLADAPEDGFNGRQQFKFYLEQWPDLQHQLLDEIHTWIGQQ